MSLIADQRSDVGGSGVEPPTPHPPASGSHGPDAGVAGLFERIPRVDAVRRPRRLPGVVGWGRLNWIALALAAAGLFWFYGGIHTALGAWTLVVAVAALLGGFVAASYVTGRRSPGAASAAFSPCAATPLLLVVLAPTVLNPADPVSGVLSIGLLAMVAVQRLLGVGCTT